MALRRLLCALSFVLIAGLAAGEAKKPTEAADPLAKFSDENLAKIDFCFEKFCEAVATKDVKTALAFLEDTPRNMKGLDPNKPDDQAKILKQMEAFSGATLVGSQRMGFLRAGEVTYKTKAGKEQTQQMRNIGGRWKIANL